MPPFRISEFGKGGILICKGKTTVAAISLSVTGGARAATQTSGLDNKKIIKERG
jgi:hypothetical protein